MIDVREGTFSGGLPYLMLGSGQPLVYLCGFTSNNRDPAWSEPSPRERRES
jgi:hypothetical protein